MASVTADSLVNALYSVVVCHEASCSPGTHYGSSALLLPLNPATLATATAWSGGRAQTTSREPCCRASGSTRLSRCAGGDDSAVTKTKISAGIEAGGEVLVGTRSARASPTLSNTSFMSLAMGAASKGSS